MYFYNWFAIYPFLSIIFENTEIIKNEIENNTYWVPWPEKNLYSNDSYKWDIIPFVYTLPSNNVNNKKLARNIICFKNIHNDKSNINLILQQLI